MCCSQSLNLDISQCCTTYSSIMFASCITSSFFACNLQWSVSLASTRKSSYCWQVGCGFPGARESRSFSIPEFPGMKTTRFPEEKSGTDNSRRWPSRPALCMCNTTGNGPCTAHLTAAWQRASASRRRPWHGGPHPCPPAAGACWCWLWADGMKW